jgi:cytidylate kinase
MPVVTLSRELGSQGSLVAEWAARDLGYRLADKTTLERVFREYGLPRLDAEYQTVPGFWDRFDLQRRDRRETLFTMLNQALRAFAQQGDIVIVGRGGFAVLAGLADVLHVRVQAPLETRIKRVAELPGMDGPVQAEERVKANDHLQKTFIESVYGMAWDCTDHFDLVLDTGKLGVAAAAAMIVQAVRALPRTAQAAGPTAGAIPVDRILASAVAEILHHHELTVG